MYFGTYRLRMVRENNEELLFLIWNIKAIRNLQSRIP